MIRVNANAITLFYSNVGEADKVVTFFTREAGKISAFANGARKLKNRFGGALEPFNHVEVSLYKKKESNPFRVEDIRVIKPFKMIYLSLEKIRLASYIARLISIFTKEESSDTGIFQLLITFLELIEKNGEVEQLARLFELKLFACCGYKLEVDACSNCRATENTNYISLVSGGLVCEDCMVNFNDSLRIIKGTSAFIRAAQEMDLGLISRLKANPASMRELKQLGENYITYLTGKPVTSFEKLALT